jgi:predicted nuclease of restriction endonuclease-like RecB superfamily
VLLAEHVLAQRRAGALVLRTLDAAARGRAEIMARELLAIAMSHVGASRGELEEALETVDALPKDVKIKAGLTKLVLDRCKLETENVVEPIALRSELFARAAEERREHGHIDRSALMARVGHAHGLESGAVERALYADLKASHRLVSVASVSPLLLVDSFVTGQTQAVLLRAERVVARIASSSPGAVRALFRALKFHRLLFTAIRDGDAYVLGIDGPMSLFESGAKYGPRLAMALPALEDAGPLELEAIIRWGKDRERLTFRYVSQSASDHAIESPLPDEVESLREALARGDEGLSVRRSDAILTLPGIGTCVPDLELEDARGRVAYVEVLGFWSRDAVWKRIELAEKGLGARVVYCVSARLRVSEEALPEALPAALYVYKGTMSARAVTQRAKALLERQLPR